MPKSLPYMTRRLMARAAIKGLSPEDQQVLDDWVRENTTCEEALDYIELALEQAFCL
jgi:hypothetical protein